MPRPRTQHRFDQLIRCAVEAFIAARGYHAMQMDDLATAAGVSKGTLYSYFENKAAVFEQALRFADHDGPIPEPEAIPVRESEPGASLESIRTRIAAHPLPGQLRQILDSDTPPGDAPKEVQSVVSLLYDTFRQNRHAIKLVDVCAKDHPEIAAAWFGPGRHAILTLLEALIRKRIDSGHYAPPPDVPFAARLVLESCVFWAIHIHWDAHPQSFEPEIARQSLCVLLTRTLAPSVSDGMATPANRGTEPLPQ
jgi:AcrR family transcriptional regulator